MSDQPTEQGANEHYFSATPADPGAITSITVRLAGRDLQVRTAPKVFSQGRLDLGTSVLLRSAPELPDESRARHFLDLGCGWGPIALTMALRRPQAQVWAVDVNDRALDLVAGTAADLGLANLRTARPEAVPADIRFDAIWSNPPIRVGKQALHDLLLTWLGRLCEDGTAHLVVQRNLGADSLTAWLAGQSGLTARKVASAKGFRVIEVEKH